MNLIFGMFMESGLHIYFTRDPSIHDSMNIPKMELNDYIYIFLWISKI